MLTTSSVKKTIREFNKQLTEIKGDIIFLTLYMKMQQLNMQIPLKERTWILFNSSNMGIVDDKL